MTAPGVDEQITVERGRRTARYQEIAGVSKSFEREPLAAASMGQVHRAVLPDGRKAVVKVQRPGVTEQMAVDLDIMERQSQSGRQATLVRARP